MYKCAFILCEINDAGSRNFFRTLFCSGFQNFITDGSHSRPALCSRLVFTLRYFLQRELSASRSAVLTFKVRYKTLQSRTLLHTARLKWKVLARKLSRRFARVVRILL